MRTAAIDAMVRLVVNVPEEVLLQMVDLDLDAALIFLARDLEEYPHVIRALGGAEACGFCVNCV